MFESSVEGAVHADEELEDKQKRKVMSLLEKVKVLDKGTRNSTVGRRFDVNKRWGDLGVDGRIILERISRRWDVCIWTGLGWPRIETGGGRFKCGNEPSGSVKCGEFLD